MPYIVPLALRNSAARAAGHPLMYHHVSPRVIPYFGGLGNGHYEMAGYGGLGSVASKEDEKLRRAAASGAVTGAEVLKVKQVWQKYDRDFAALTTGKKPKTAAQAVAIIGKRPTIEEIVGHALVVPSTVTVPGGGAPPPPSEEKGGLPIVPIAIGLGLLGLFVASRRK